MVENNPYKSPSANPEEGNQLYVGLKARMEKMVLGQKLINYSAYLYIISIGLRITISPIFIVIFPFALVLSLVGLFKILSARDSHIVVKAILFVLLFVPVINIVVLLNINGQVIRSLRSAKYKAGFMSAKTRSENT